MSLFAQLVERIEEQPVDVPFIAYDWAIKCGAATHAQAANLVTRAVDRGLIMYAKGQNSAILKEAKYVRKPG